MTYEDSTFTVNSQIRNNTLDADAGEKNFITYTLVEGSVEVKNTAPINITASDINVLVETINVYKKDIDGNLTDEVKSTYDKIIVTSDKFNALDSDETLTLTFNVKADDGLGLDNSVSDEQTVTVEITGTNDTPVIEAVEVINVSEANLTETSSFTLNTADLKGALTVTDEDENESYSVNLISTTANIGNFTSDIEGAKNPVKKANTIISQDEDGNITISNSEFEKLSDGETVDVTFSIDVIDDNGIYDPSADSANKTMTVTITGTNDAPEINNMEVSVTENSFKNFKDTPDENGETIFGIENKTYADFVYSNQLEANDVDTNDTHTFEKANINENVAIELALVQTDANLLTAYQAASVDSTAFAYIKAAFAQIVANPMIEALVGESDTLKTLQDKILASTTLAEAEAVINNFAYTEGGDNPFKIESTLTEIRLIATATPVQASILETNNFLNISVTQEGGYTVATPFVNLLGEGEKAELSFGYTATDSQGASSSDVNTLKLSITGSNDKPTIKSYKEETNVQEDSLSGSISFEDVQLLDVDLTDIHEFVPLDDVLVNIKKSDTDIGEVRVSMDSEGNYTLAGDDIDKLAKGDTATVSFQVSVTDNSGASNEVSTSRTITVTIDGENDKPEITDRHISIKSEIVNSEILIEYSDNAGGIPEEITILQKYELFAKPKLKAEDYVSTSRDNIIMEGLQACPSLSDALFE